MFLQKTRISRTLIYTYTLNKEVKNNETRERNQNDKSEVVKNVCVV